MSGLESDTIGGFNSMLERQKQESGDARVTTVLFDDRYELLHDRIDLQGIAPITQREYYVRGCTALLDAIGLTIEKIDRVQRNTAPELRADKVLFVITTDGLENASRRFRLPQIRAMIERHKEAFGWEFLFLGANIDAIATARQYGIGADRAVNYHADRRGTRINYEVLSRAASCIRANQPLGEDWKAEIEADYAARKPERR
jgi:hypothetical protein